jgi:protochlorophyllide reductase
MRIAVPASKAQLCLQHHGGQSMATSKLFVITGATSGMGLELARALVRSPFARLIVGARAPAKAHQLGEIAPSSRLSILPLDLENLESVRSFAAAAASECQGAPIGGIACNAGIQLPGPLELTEIGVERTFAANHLGHFLLVHALLPYLAPGAPVVSTASGTHDPADKLARRFGFRGAIFPNADAVARGVLDPKASITQQGIDRYATSKLCNILFTSEMARRVPPEQARFIAFDPGLMPGTGLARERSAFEQFGWSRLMPALKYVVSGVSTPQRSAAALAEVLNGVKHTGRTGLHVDYTLAETQTSDESRRPELARDLYDTSARLSGVAPTCSHLATI